MRHGTHGTHRRKLLGATILATAMFGSAAMADDFPVEATITDVTVFGYGALVAREADISVSTGDHKVIFRGLPSGFDENSIRMAAGGAAGTNVMIGSVEVRTIERTEALAERQRELLAQLKVLQGQQSALNDTVRAADMQLGFLKGLSEGYAGEGQRQVAEGRVDADGWQRAYDLIGNGADGAMTRIRAARTDMNMVTEQINAVQRELNRIGRGRKTEREIHVPFSADGSGSARFQLSFMVGRATWAPNYEARLDAASGEITLTQEAAITQNTGEAWDNVNLRLATGTPSVNAQLPDFDTWYVDLEEPYQPREARKELMRTMAPEMAMAESDAFEEVIVTGSRVQGSSIVDTGFTTEFVIPGRVSVSASGDAQQFRVTEVMLDGDIIIRTAPSYDARALLYARFEYDGEVPLFGGKMSAFVGGVFTGSSTLKTILPGRETEIAFGVDERVAVTYTDEDERKSEQGILSKREMVEQLSRTEITNGHDRAITLEVYDRLPVSKTEDLQIKWLKTATRPDEENVDDIEGLLLWSRELAPAATLELRTDFSMSFPKGKNVVGR